LAGFRFLQKGSLCCLESAALAGCDFLVHAFCTRQEGVSGEGFSSLNFSTRTGDDPQRVKANWGLLSDAFAIPPGRFLAVNQVHGDCIITIDRPDFEIPFRVPFPGEADLSCDAVLTNQPGLAVGIKTADCVPIFLADRAKRLIGAVHAGWRGTALGIAGKAVDTLTERFSSRVEDILVAIGPSIGPCCYRVDDTVLRAMPSSARGQSFFRPAGEAGRWMMDLPEANRRQLEERGIPRQNIGSSGVCTSCRRDLFFSHRRDGQKTGRHFNFIMVRGRGETAGKNRLTG
jgi:polyphenol oxidase